VCIFESQSLQFFHTTDCRPGCAPGFLKLNVMDIKELIKRLSEDIERESSYIKKHGGDKAAISWVDEEGVLISVLEAELFSSLLKALLKAF